VFSLGCSFYVVSTSASDWLERLVSKMTCNVLMGTLNPTHSFTHSLTHSPEWWDYRAEKEVWRDSALWIQYTNVTDKQRRNNRHRATQRPRLRIVSRGEKHARYRFTPMPTPIWGGTVFCMWGRTVDVTRHAKFQMNRFRGFGAPGSENDPLLTWHIALTTVYALTCYTVIQWNVVL